MSGFSQGPTITAQSALVGSNRLLAAGSHATLFEHEKVYGSLSLSGIDVNFISVLERSGLTGRGGAAFASWRKFAAISPTAGLRALRGKPVVIGNGAEGEPLSFKDKVLLEHAPHLVIDGLLVAARAISASSIFLYVSAAFFPAVQSALAERTDASGIQLVEAADTFVSGQASAVVNAVAGGPAVPRGDRRRLSESGVKGRPTLVVNVETLGHVALIARYGAEWFRVVGSEQDPGTRLYSLSGWGEGQVLEVEGDARLGAVLERAGVDVSAVQAVLVGGYHGRWVDSWDYRLSPEGSADRSVRPGAGVLHVLPWGRCGVEVTAQIVRYLADQSAKQCGPCLFGLPSLATVWDALARGEHDLGLVEESERLASLVRGRGACHHPDGTVQLIDSALDIFATDVEDHRGGRCRGRVGGHDA